MKELVENGYDGVVLRGQIDAPADPKAACVIVHGLAEHYGRYDYLTEKLNAAGYAVVRFDHRGHGKSDGKRVWYEDHTEIVKDTDVFVDLAKQEFPGLPLFMIGHSMGGFGATSYGTTFPGKVNYYVISGAVTRMSGGVPPMDPSLPDDLYFPNALGDGVCSDKSVGAAYEADPLVGHEISVKIFRVIGAGIEWLKANGPVFVDPIMIMHGADDGLVAAKDSLLFYDEISSTDKSLRIYGGLMHEIFNEFKKDLVIRDAIEWMDDRLTGRL